MFRNYIKISLRNLLRHKIFSAINILGLATGIACCLLITIYVYFETSYDRFNENAGRIFRVTMEYAADNVVNKVSVTGNKVFPAFKRTFPEVENGVRLYPAAAVVKYRNKLFDEKSFVYSDSTLFDIFSFKLLQGNPKKVLDKPNMIVVTTSTAKKYFGNEDPVGKILRINNEKDYVVTGVVTDCPSNSQIKFDFLASFSSLRGDRYDEETWWDASYYTYLLLKTPGAAKSLQAKIPAYMKSQDKENAISNGNYLTFHVEPLKDVHLYSTVEGGFEPAGDYHYVYIFSFITLLILAIACFNYINITTARAAERAKEVGVRKVMGALRKELIKQFMSESILNVLLALLISLLLVKLFLPTFNLLAAKQLSLASVFQPVVTITLLTILLAISLLGGVYPALVLSGFNPVKVLKGNFKTSTSGIWLRKSLIVVQFIISVGLIVSTIIIQSQLSFIQNKKLGYNKDQIVVLPLDKFMQAKLSTFKTEFLSIRNIQSVTTCNQTPAYIPGKYSLSLDHREMIITAVRTDKDFIKTLQLKLISGSDFTDVDQKNIDSENIRRPLILNESALRLLGWKPDQAVGKFIQFQGTACIIKGVVNDFHFSSMHEAIGPFVIFLSNNTHNLLVKLSGNNIPKTLQFMNEKWNVLAPHRPFEYEFLNDEFNKLYSTETKTGELFYVFALLAIGLACLGLFGLVAFSAQQRTKEIGIRKVLGANIAGIVGLLSKEFLQLVLIASLIAFPVAWWAMNRWLQDFAYRINIQWWMFAVAGIAAILIALITVSFRVIKAAVANPVKSLRTE
jgi:putative ABC transport system permease protein